MILNFSRLEKSVRPVVNSMVAVLLAASMAVAQVPPEMDRIAFLIATGPVAGSAMQMGEAIAVTISHPPGLGRCETPGVCGPKGLIATTRSSSGSVANARSVERGSVQSALVQGDLLDAALKGTGPFAKDGKLKELRVVARLHDEVLHVIVSSQSRVRRLADLRGKRVAIDSGSLDAVHTVRTMLQMAGVRIPGRNLRAMSVTDAAESLRTRKVDALFVMGVTPVRSLEPLFRRGQLKLVTVDNRTLERLKRANPLYGKVRLMPGTYRSSGEVQALTVASVWVVRRAMEASVVEQILRAFWARENRADIEARVPFAASLDVRNATSVGSMPLHEGAERFYARARP